MLIRAATRSDLGAVQALWNAMIRDTTATFTTILKTPDDMVALLEARKQAFLVADDGGTCTGFMTWGPFRAGPGYRYTAEHTIIAASSRGGTGGLLMQAAVAQAAAQDIHVLIGAISGENSAALAFHQKWGFARSGHLPQVGHKAGRWHDLILMSRIIGAS